MQVLRRKLAYGNKNPFLKRKISRTPIEMRLCVHKGVYKSRNTENTKFKSYKLPRNLRYRVLRWLLMRGNLGNREIMKSKQEKRGTNQSNGMNGFKRTKIARPSLVESLVLLWGFMAPRNLFWYGGIATDRSHKGVLSK